LIPSILGLFLNFYFEKWYKCSFKKSIARKNPRPAKEVGNNQYCGHCAMHIVHRALHFGHCAMHIGHCAIHYDYWNQYEWQCQRWHH
jgi:hypothetical protein